MKYSKINFTYTHDGDIISLGIIPNEGNKINDNQIKKDINNTDNNIENIPLNKHNTIENNNNIYSKTNILNNKNSNWDNQKILISRKEKDINLSENKKQFESINNEKK